MSELEIARRCLSCGAAVRGRASFCPQCGILMDGASIESETAAAQAETQEARQPDSLVEEAARVANTLNDKLPPLFQEPGVSDNHTAARPQQQQQQPFAPEEEAEAVGAHALQPSEREGSAGEAAAKAAITNAEPREEMRGRMRERAASVGASVGGNLRPRVEKLREASTVVFDEATDDPGLRFVIVAVLLFLLFLFILLFSYILG